MKYKDLTITKTGHAGVRIEQEGVVVYLDPFQLRDNQPKADFILISHNHYDHLSPKDIQKVLKPATIIVASDKSQEQLAKLDNQKVFLTPDSVENFDRLDIRTVPAYNVNKFRSKGELFHPLELQGLGFLLTIGEVTFYHAGDTDHIPEMSTLPHVDMAFLPVSGTYVMTAEEAALAAKDIHCEVAIPMHYGAIVGDKNDALRFQKLYSGRAEILD